MRSIGKKNLTLVKETTKKMIKKTISGERIITSIQEGDET